MSNLSVIILAAGNGTRMKSSQPKHLHKIGNLEIVSHIIKTAEELGASEIIVVCNELNSEYINNDNVKKVVQYEKLGTAHATKIGYDAMDDKDNDVVIMYGDTPLVRSATYKNMLSKLNGDTMQVGLIFKTKDITNRYGRVKVEGDRVIYNIEYKEADAIMQNSDLCNGANLASNGRYLGEILKKIKNNNTAKEYYLTDTINISNEDGYIFKYILVDEDEVQGVNSREDLSKAEKIFQDSKREQVMKNGATLVDPNTTYFSYDTEIGQDVIIEPNVVFSTGVKIKNNIIIGAFSYLKDCVIEDGEIIEPYSKYV
ncbi:MAG: NTP transferase domain-containing protein [Rickettsiales bacterium]|jgi:bifunctional UDP-N-acetylglucosamine pyrophosphorylase/glucosamine-1-phosphate N-acetyltransferase|nr:NTP transferase domain-containing protein [Rickettsiales bacterium]